MMKFNTRTVLNDDFTTHELAGTIVTVQPVEYQTEVKARIISVLSRTAVVEVLEFNAIDRFVNNEKSSFAVVELTKIKQCLEGVVTCTNK